MSPDQIFAIANGLALLCWVLLVLFPRRDWVNPLTTSVIFPIVMASLYTSIVLWTFASAEGSFSSLDEVALLFGNKWLLLAGWIHYLAFDLLVGSWEARDSRERGISRLVMVPILLLTFLFGPAGWLTYMAVRSAPGRAIATR